MSDKIREYAGDDIVIKFDARRCIHAAECVKGLPGVFERGRRPWVDANAATPDRTAEVIMRCPTGALKFQRRDGGGEEPTPAENSVRLEPDGPCYATGDIEIVDGEGSIQLSDTRVAFCRCGASQNKPFCDGRHSDAGFRAPGTLPDERPADQEITSGQKLTVTPLANGSLLLQGPVTIRDAEGRDEVTRMKISLCRCGASKKKPFCDGSHKATGFTAA